MSGRMISRRSVLTLAACTALGAVGCSKTEEYTGPELILRYAENQPEDYPTTQAALAFADLVAERTEGRVKVVVYSGGELGAEQTPRLDVFNKCDRYLGDIRPHGEDIVSISARTGEGVEELLDGLAAYAFTNTTIAGSIAMIVWMLYDWHYDRKPSFSGVLVGAVAGLATITPCAGYVEPWAAIIIGAVGSSVCYYAKYVQERLGFDDALEVWRAHGMGGVTGALLLGILASSNIDKVNASIHQFLMQLLGVIIVAVYSFVVTIIIFKVISAWGPIRVTKEEEEAGLDESLHGEEAYKM